MKLHESPGMRKRIRIAAIVFGVILLVADWLLAAGVGGVAAPTADKIGRAILISILLLVLELVIEVYLMIDGSLGDQEDVSLEASKFISHNRGSMAAMASEHLHNIMEQRRHAVRIDLAGRSYVVDNRSLAVDTYCSFWKLLAARQLAIFEKHRGKPPANACLEVRAIHATNIYIWLDRSNPVTNEVLAAHDLFTKKKGVITRILLCDQPDPDENYQKAIDNMTRVGASVGYRKVDFRTYNSAPRWDFMIVGERGRFERGDDDVVALIWAQADAQTGTPLRAVYSLSGRFSEHPKPLRETWQENFDDVEKSQFWEPYSSGDRKSNGTGDGVQ